MEHNATNVVSVTLKCVHLPVLISWESPELDCLIICAWSNYFHCWMKSNPIDSLFVAFDDVLDLHFSATKDLIRSASLFLHAFLLKSWEVPNSNSLIKWCRCEKSLLWMKASGHYVVRVTSQDSYNASILPVPYAYGLIIWAWTDPRQILVEFYCPNIIQVSCQSKETLFCLIVPHLNLMIITSTDEEGLSLMKVDTTDRTYRKKHVQNMFIPH
jgi:hypothetical protein